MEFNATLIVSAISFIVFMLIMNAILYQPILNVLQQRAEFIDSNLDEARNVKDKAASILEDKNQKIKAAHKKAKETIAGGVEDAKSNKSKVVSDATSVSRQKIEEEKTELLNTCQAAKDVLKSNVLDLAKDISEKLLGHPVHNLEFNQEIVDEAINNA